MVKIVYIEGRTPGYQRLRDQWLNKLVTPEELVELASKYDVLLITRNGEVTAWIDRQGARFKQM
ncbi:MAG: hypothetical protein ACWGQW_01495 [bacterium]